MRLTPARALVAAAMLAAAVPSGAAAAPSGACPDRVTMTKDGWRRTEAPRFAVGEAGITAYAVASDAATTTYVTNGTNVMRSTDDGCSWGSVFTVPETPTAEMPFARATASVADLVATKKRAYALVDDPTGPRVAVSADGGRTWKATAMPGVGLLAYHASKLAADLDGMTAYVLVKTVGAFGAGDLLYVTTDGGATWTPRPIDSGSANLSGAVDVAVDPLAGEDVFVALQYGLLQSSDHGETWAYSAPPGAASVTAITVTHRPGRARQVIAVNGFEPVVYIRTAVGTWTTVNTPGMVSSAVGGRTTRQAAITTASGVYELDYAALKWLPIHGRTPALTQLETDFTNTPSIYACECAGPRTALWSRAPRRADDEIDNRFDGRTEEAPGYPGFDGCAPSKSRQAAAPFAPSRLSVAEVISLQPGRSVTLPVRLHVQPRELDVYFLVDSGPRSYYFTCQAKQGTVWAADELSRTRNLRAGAGQYRDFITVGVPNGITTECVAVGGSRRPDFVYRRDVRVGPVDDLFRSTVSRTTVGGGCTADHAGLTALYQAATGRGQDVAPAGTSPYDIKAGQDAGFAPGAYRVVVHVAGGYFAQPSATYPGNSWEQAIGALRGQGIKQVGIHVPYPDKKNHTGEPRPDETGADDLRRVARETGTLSTRAIDCGSRVITKVAVGAPLVCSFVDDTRSKKPTAPPMGRQMVDLVTALRDPKPMRLAVVSGNAKLRSAAAGVRDHLVAHTLTSSVTFTCGTGDAGSVQRVELAGQVGTEYVATATAQVRCGTLPVRRPPDLYDPGAALPLSGGVAVANTLPNLQPQTQPASQSQANPQQLAQMAGAAVPQEQGQPRLAYANVEPPHENTAEELAMSGLPPTREEDVPIWAFVNAVAVLGAAGAVALRRRTSAAAAKVRR